MSKQHSTVPSVVMPLNAAATLGVQGGRAGSLFASTFESLEQRVMMAGQPAAADNSMAYDAVGNLHVAYYDATEKSLKYSRQSLAGTWTEPVTVDSSSADTGKMASLAIDKFGHPGVAYFDAANEDLRYAYNDGTRWTSVKVDSKESVGQNPSLTFDAKGTAIISYYRKTTGDLKLATLKSLKKNKWTLSTVVKTGDVGEYSSVAIDPASGKPIVAFSDGAGHVAFASAKKGGFNKPVIIDSLTGNAANVDIAIGTNGQPAISYYDPTAGVIKLAEPTDSRAKFFSSQAVADVPAGSNPSPVLLIDPITGTPQIVYYNADTDGVFVAKPPTDGTTTIITTQLKAGGGEGFSAALQPGNNSISFGVVDGSGGSSPLDLGNNETTPLPPTEVAAVAVTPAEVAITWTDNSTNETGYLIERSTDGTTFGVVATISGNLTGYLDDTVSEANTYYYRVSATGGAGETAVGTVGATLDSTIHVAQVVTPPNAPGSLAAMSAASDRIELSWTDHSNGETGYRVQRRLAASSTWGTIDALGADSTQYSDSTVSEGAAYVYRVFAVYGTVSSATSDEVAATARPATPIGLTVTPFSTTQLDLAWTNPSAAAEAFVVERSTDGSTFVAIATLDAHVTAFQDSGRSEGTVYYYRVKAVAAEESDYSSIVNATTSPNAPSNLAATPTSASRIDLSWTDNAASESGYVIQRATAGGAFVTVATVAANTTSYADAGRSEGVSYSYRIRATITGSADSAYSATVSTTTLPSAPTSLAAALASNGTRIALTWTDNASGETGYHIERQTLGSSTWTLLTTTAADVATYTDTTPAEGTTYSYRVRAANGVGFSAYTSNATATTLATAPASLTATAASATSINLVWSDQSAGETGFIIERSTDGTTFSLLLQVSANVTQYTDSGRTAATSYTYRVRATNAGGDSANSNSATGTTLCLAPTSLVATSVLASQIDLSWTASTGATSYAIERSADAGTTWAQVATRDAATFSDTGVSEAQAYSYRVKANNAGGSSAASGSASATSRPAAPTAITAVASSPTAISLSWTDHSAGETGFAIERSIDGGTTFSALATLSSNVTTYSDAAVTEGGAYVYRVRATGAGGASTNATSAAVTTPPALATGLSGVANSDNTVTLNWTDASTHESGYKVQRSSDGIVFADAATLSADAASYTDSSSLSVAATYTYRVIALGSGGNSTSAETAVTTRTLAPTSLTATPASTSTINLAWTAPAGATGFVVERSADGVSYSVLATLTNATPTTYSDTTGTEAHSYYYRVKATNGGGASAYVTASATTQPAAPTSLALSATSATSVGLSWSDNSAGEDGYYVEVSTDGGSNFTVAGAVSASQTTYTATVGEGSAPAFRVRAIVGGVYSNYSATASTTTVPAAPTLLGVQSVSDTALTVTWTDHSSNETGFRIERSNDGGTSYVEVGTTSANVTSFADTGLTEGTSYSYRVRATMGSSRNSLYSSEAANNTRPSTPTSVLAGLVSGVVDVSWTNPSVNADSFTIERSADSGGTWSTLGTSTSTVYSDTTAVAGTTYTYRVTATNEGGDSGHSATAAATLVPATPTNVVAAGQPSGSTIRITWNDVAGETSYKLYKSTDGTTWNLLTTPAANATSYNDSAVVENATYSYRIRAVNGSGESADSTIAGGSTSLVAPTSVLVTSTPAAATVTWHDNSAGESGYLVERSVDTGAHWTTAGSISADTETYTDSTVAQGTAYSYRVSAVNGGVTSQPTAATTITPLETPTSFTGAGVSASQIDLSWTNAAVNQTGFQIFRSSNGVAYTQIDFVGSGVTSYSDSGRAEATTYYYKVRAANDVSRSALTSVATVLTRPAAPSAVVATADTDTQISLSWTNNSAGATGFTIRRSADAGTTWSTAGTTSGATTFTDTGVSEGVAYSYEVLATNASGASTAATGTATTLPATPTSLAATASAPTTVGLTWTNASSHASQVRIEKRPSGGIWATLATVSGSTSSYSDTGAAEGLDLQYRVVAIGTHDSSASATASVSTPPLAATGLVADVLSDTEIHLTWTDNSAHEGSYLVQRALTGGSFATLTTLVADSSDYTDSSGSEGTSYDYRIVAVRNATQTNSSSVTTQTAPAAPTGLAATSSVAGTIHLAWSDHSAHETAFEIERSNDNVTFSSLTTTASDATSYDDTTVAAGSTHYYRIHAGQTVNSTTTASVTGLSRPAAPSSVAASVTSDSTASVTWGSVTSATSYLVQRSDDGVTFSTVATVSTTSLADTGLSESTQYTYRVIADNSAGDGVASTIATATTIPSAVTALSATGISPTRVDLAWTNHSSSATAYRVMRALGSGSFAQIGSDLASSADSYSDTTVVGGTSYRYTVVAYDGANVSSQVAPSSVTTVPSAVTSLQGSSDAATSATITWAAPTGATTYAVERSLDGTTFSPLATASTNSYHDTSVAEGTLYTYRVSPTNSAGNGPSATTTITTLPAGVTNLSVTSKTDTSVTLGWSDSSTGETGYVVERSPDGTNWTTLVTTAASAVTYTDTTASEAQTYAYRATPVDAGGTGTSNVVDVTTLPAAPDTLAIASSSISSVGLTWADHSAGETAYAVYRSTNGGSFVLLNGTLASGSQSYTDTAVLAGTGYTYKVAAIGAGGTSAFSATAAVTTVPAAVSDLTSTMISTTQVDLAWSDVSGNTSYRIERKTGSGSFAEIVNSLGVNATDYSDTTVSEGLLYNYRIFAVNGGGDSVASNTAASTTPPDAPSSLSASPTTATNIHLTWTDNSVGETAVEVQRFDGSAWTTLATTAANAVTYDDTVAAGSTFTYRVFATNVGGDSGLSATSAATTVPAAPANAVATSSAIDTVSVSWTLSTGATGYRVMRSDDGGSTYSQTGSDLSSTDHTFSDGSLSEATAYTYQVIAFNATGTGAASTTSNVATQPIAPSGLGMLSLGTTGLTLTWTDHSAGEDGFAIERSSDNGTTWSSAGTAANISSTGGGGSVSQTGLTEATEYLYRVAATLGSQQSDWSSSFTVDTKPVAPSALAVSSFTDTAVSLAWTDGSGGESGYKVERSTDGGTTFSVIATLGANTTTYTDSGRSQSSDYVYKVRGFKNTSYSDYTATASATTRPTAPSSLSASAASPTSVDLTWADNASAEDGFVIERSTDAGDSWSQAGTALANATTYTDSSVPESAAASYRVYATQSGVQSDNSGVATATTPVAIPTGISATATAYNAVHVTWTDNSSVETSQRVERSLDGGTTWSSLTTVAASATSYDDASVSEDTGYQYRIVAIKGSAESTASSAATATTPLAPPTGFASSAYTATSVTLTWTNHSAAGTSVRVERYNTGSSAWDQLSSLSASATTYTDSAAAEGTAYDYRVYASKSGNASAYAATVSVTTLPTAPTSFAAGVFSQTEIDLTWTDNSAGETGYRIERSVDGGAYSTLTTTAANAASYNDTSVTEGGTFAYLVYALGAGGSSTQASASASTSPNDPTSFVVTPVNATRIDLAWADNSAGETSYVVQRSTNGGGIWSALVTLDPGTTSYSDTTVAEAASYSYRVRAVHASAVSAWATSNTTTIPATPTGLASSVPAGSPRVVLTWNDQSAGETGYQIDRSLDGASWSTVTTTAAGVTTFSDSTVAEGLTYSYRVRATSSAGPSAWSATTAASTLPATPTSLAASAINSTRVDLTWSDASSNELGYKVERQASGSGTWTLAATLAANSASYSDTAASEGVTYQYRVRAYTSAANGNPSASVSASTPLAAPSSIAATAISTTQVNLTWTDNSTAESSFKVERSNDGGSSYTTIATLGANTGSYSDTTASAGTTYLYRVKVTKSALSSTYSTSSAVTTVPTDPASPSAAANSDTQVTLSWTDAAGETGYTVERSANAGSTWTVLSSAVAANATSYVDSGGSENSAYLYRVKATNAAGASAYATAASVTTLPTAPSGLVASSASSDTAVLNWVDHSSAEGGFRIERRLSGGSYAEIATVSANVVTYTDPTVSESVAYEYRIRATTSGRNSVYSNSAAVSTLPLDPTSLVVSSATTTSATLGWANASGAPTVIIERSDDGGDTFDAIGTAAGTDTTYTDTGRTEGTTYQYRIRAYNGAGGFSGYTNSVIAVTLPLSAGSFAASTSTPVQVALTWTDRSAGEQGYIIERSDHSANAFVELVTLDADTSSYTDVAVSTGNSFDYRIRSFNNGGSSVSSIVSAVVS